MNNDLFDSLIELGRGILEVWLSLIVIIVATPVLTAPLWVTIWLFMALVG